MHDRLSHVLFDILQDSLIVDTAVLEDKKILLKPDLFFWYEKFLKDQISPVKHKTKYKHTHALGVCYACYATLCYSEHRYKPIHITFTPGYTIHIHAIRTQAH